MIGRRPSAKRRHDGPWCSFPLSARSPQSVSDLVASWGYAVAPARKPTALGPDHPSAQPQSLSSDTWEKIRSKLGTGVALSIIERLVCAREENAPIRSHVSSFAFASF